ncbi:hypothetical protein [uncultured Hymenobacter sp.]|uniref:hypothetical protein n=1 Tax=uncultured Hymenobacter sp. TaxID=170016 RepID=UPI0035CC2FDB
MQNSRKQVFTTLPLEFLNLAHITAFLTEQSKRGIEAKIYNNYRNSLSAAPPLTT